LVTAVDNAGAGTAISYSPTALPATTTLSGNLGPATNFAGQTFAGSVAAGATNYYAFSIRASEIASTANGEALLRVVVRGAGGTLQPALPQVAGLTPRSTYLASDHAEALVAVN